MRRALEAELVEAGLGRLAGGGGAAGGGAGAGGAAGAATVGGAPRALPPADRSAAEDSLRRRRGPCSR